MVSKKKIDAKAVLKTTCEYVQEGTATVMLPDMLMLIFDQELWKEWTTSTGGKFESFNHAVTANQPYGLGIGQYNGWINASQAWTLCKGHSGVRRELLKLAVDEVKPIAKHGGAREQGRKTTLVDRGVDYLLGVMKRSANAKNKKAIAALDGLRSGRLTSVRQAAIKCGIIKPNGSDRDRCPIDRIKMYWKRASAEQRQELLEWLKTAEAKLVKGK